MQFILIFTTFLVYACALPTYDSDPINRSDPRHYKDIEILSLESAIDQYGAYSFSFTNDDGSKVSQEGRHKIIDDEQVVPSIHGAYSYNDSDGEPISLTYTADENGFRPIGAHLPTSPPIPVDILRSLRYLATAKPYVDEELYNYKPKKKVYRGRQYKTENPLRRAKIQQTVDEIPEYVKLIKDSDASNIQLPLNIQPLSNIQPASRKQPASWRQPVSRKQSGSTIQPGSSIQPGSTIQSGFTIQPGSNLQSIKGISQVTNEQLIHLLSFLPPTVESAFDAVKKSKNRFDAAILESSKAISQISDSVTQYAVTTSMDSISEISKDVTGTVQTEVTETDDKISDLIETIAKDFRDSLDELTETIPNSTKSASVTVEDTLSGTRIFNGHAGT